MQKLIYPPILKSFATEISKGENAFNLKQNYRVLLCLGPRNRKERVESPRAAIIQEQIEKYSIDGRQNRAKCAQYVWFLKIRGKFWKVGFLACNSRLWMQIACWGCLSGAGESCTGKYVVFNCIKERKYAKIVEYCIKNIEQKPTKDFIWRLDIFTFTL